MQHTCVGEGRGAGVERKRSWDSFEEIVVFFFQFIFSRLPRHTPSPCMFSHPNRCAEGCLVWRHHPYTLLPLRSTRLCQSFHLSKLTRPPGSPETRPLTHSVSLSPCTYHSTPVSTRNSLLPPPLHHPSSSSSSTSTSTSTSPGL